jgi:hypothetical protein
MQEGKVYALKMEIRSVAGEGLIEGRKYVVKIVKGMSLGMQKW